MTVLTARLGGLPLRDLAPPALLVGLVVLVELFAPASSRATRC